MLRGALGLAVLCLLLGVAPARAQLPPTVQQGTREAEAECRSAGGRPSVMPAFRTQLDFNGDGQPDYVHDFTGLDCAGAASFFCGSAGCPVVVYVSPGYRAQALGHAQGWTADRTGALPVMVLDLHGSACGRAGSAACQRRIGWNGREMAALGAGRPAAPTAPPPAAPPLTAGPQAAQPVPAQPGGSKSPQPAAGAAPVQPAAPPGQAWQVRQSADGRTVAMVAGPGVVRAVSALCHMGTPVLALTLRARPPAGPVTLTLAGRGERASVGLTQLGSGETWIADLRGSAVPRLLSGQDSALDVLINGGQQGRVSMQGSSRSVREALAGCGGA